MGKVSTEVANLIGEANNAEGVKSVANSLAIFPQKQKQGLCSQLFTDSTEVLPPWLPFDAILDELSFLYNKDLISV